MNCVLRTKCATGALNTLAAVTLSLTGCGLTGPPSARNSAADDAPGLYLTDVARALSLDQHLSAALEGELTTAEDIDVYDLGDVRCGDHLQIEVTSQSELDPAVGIFDEAGNLIVLHDDEHFYKELHDARVDMVLRRDSAHCYVVVAASPKSDSGGEYTLTLTYTPEVGVEQPTPQLVYLNFEGGVDVPIGPTEMDVPPFEDAGIATYCGDDIDHFLGLLVGSVRADFAGLNVLVVSSGEDAEPDAPHSTVYFGNHDPSALGRAENVDDYNERLVQNAVVFVDTFRVFLPLNPTPAELAQAMANTTSHEIGHLLGLHHTQDPRDVMGIGITLQAKLADQSLRRSPLSPYVFPVGHQDAVRLLLETTGGDASLINGELDATLRARPQPAAQSEGVSCRADLPLSGCAGRTYP